MTDQQDLESRYGNRIFSQEGEDLVLWRLFGERAKGFYVDVGAHHPIRFSNTYLFHKRGWRGINIDATPGVKELFDEHRPQDTNIECLVSEQSDEILEFDIYGEYAINSGVAGRRSGAYETLHLKSRRLDSIL